MLNSLAFQLASGMTASAAAALVFQATGLWQNPAVVGALFGTLGTIGAVVIAKLYDAWNERRKERQQGAQGREQTTAHVADLNFKERQALIEQHNALTAKMEQFYRAAMDEMQERILALVEENKGLREYARELEREARGG